MLIPWGKRTSLITPFCVNECMRSDLIETGVINVAMLKEMKDEWVLCSIKWTCLVCDEKPLETIQLEDVCSVCTCNSSLSSPITAAVFQSMISEKGSSQPLLSITGTQAACGNITHTKTENTELVERMHVSSLYSYKQENRQERRENWKIIQHGLCSADKSNHCTWSISLAIPSGNLTNGATHPLTTGAL